MIRTSALSSVVLLGVALLAPTTTYAAGETCRGEAATLVGAPQSEVTGTEGRDVVVTNAASYVGTLGGDDLVCVTGGGVATVVATGAGRDVVDATAAGPAVLRLLLGGGADTFDGAAPTLDVWADDSPTPGLALDSSVDVVRVAALPGARTVVGSGQQGLPNADVIRLAGSGDVTWNGSMAPGAELVGGAGDNRLTASLPAGDVDVDLAASTATGTGGSQLRWSGFESYSFSDLAGAVTQLDVSGSRRNDAVDLVLHRGLRITAALGRGDDVLNTSAVGAEDSSYRGGAGRDLIGVAAWGNVDLDLDAGVLSGVVGGERTRADVSSFQDAHVWGRRVTVTGDDAPNRLTISGCRGSRAAGGRGADHLLFSPGSPTDPRTCRGGGTARYDGGRGNDRIAGGPADDILVGGPGRDRVDGASGIDSCQAETTTSCAGRG